MKHGCEAAFLYKITIPVLAQEKFKVLGKRNTFTFYKRERHELKGKTSYCKDNNNTDWN